MSDASTMLNGALRERDTAMRHARLWSITAHVARHPVERDRAQRQVTIAVRHARGHSRRAVAFKRLTH